MSFARWISIVVAVVVADAAKTIRAADDVIHVSLAGDHAADGSADHPYHTLAAACSSKSVGGHTTIRLGSGTFSESQSCRIPAGVSVVGAGASATVLRWADTAAAAGTVDMEANPYVVHPDRFLIQVADSTEAELSGFTVDGGLPGGERAHGGVIISRSTRGAVHDVTARSFDCCAIGLFESNGSTIGHCQIDDSGHPNKQSCSGGIMVGDLTDCAIDSNVIREHRGALGIKAWRLSYNEHNPGPSPIDRNVMNRVRFTGNDIVVRQQGGWGSGQPNMAMEIWNTRATDCEITGNQFNECVSLICDRDAGGVRDKRRTIHVYNNRFSLEPGYSYAIEVGMRNLEIDHNYFAHGVYPLADWNGPVDGVRVHDNVFDGIENVALMDMSTGVRDFRFEYNTVVVSADLPMLQLESNESIGVTIAHNLFVKIGQRQTGKLVALKPDKNHPDQPTSIRAGSLTIIGNAFVNWPVTGRQPIIVESTDGVFASTQGKGAPTTVPTANDGARSLINMFRLRPEGVLGQADVGARQLPAQ